MEIDKQLEQLNQAQRTAVTYKPCNLLVLAGAGSGKTRVLVNRFAWLLTNFAESPRNMFAVTFTNKAAKEMLTRIQAMCQQKLAGAWVGTFHSLAHRLLRLHHLAANLPKSFRVIDSDDQLKIIRKILAHFNINDSNLEPKKIQHFIGRQKDQGIRFKDLAAPKNRNDRIMLDVYSYYEEMCRKEGIVDFGELLLRSYEMLASNEELLTHYQARFKHFLVDEFQDTNAIQYKWLQLLAKRAQSVTIVGDDDQSIYGWRGARMEHMQQYTQDFNGVQQIKLEKNYRSTETILTAANALIDNNQHRMGKTLWTDSEKGVPIQLYAALNEEDEALFITRRIKEYCGNGNYQDVGVLYRSNAQSRVIEEGLTRAGIPYVVYGGVSFFERAEIKNALCYLSVASNHSDDSAFERIVNMPTRGIGERSLSRIKMMAAEKDLSLVAAAKEMVDCSDFTGPARTGLAKLLQILEKIAKLLAEESLTTIVQKTIEYSGLLEYYKGKGGEENLNRIANLEELVNATADFHVEDTKQLAVDEFLSYISLAGREHQGKSNQQAVQLMTLHSAKGLEFPKVFMCGVEEDLFPHYFNASDQRRLNEERRLCYVGITRAMQELCLSYAKNRRLYGREMYREPSRFIKEIPKELIKEHKRKLQVITSRELTKKSTKIAVGNKVRHNKFGVGVILDLDGKNDKKRVCVKFNKAGTKWLMLSHANLQAMV